MTSPKLSILICSLHDRFLGLYHLLEKLQDQIAGRSDVEVLWLGDLRSRTVGEKRETLKNIAKGDYIVYLDDDDDIPDYYVDEVLKAIEKKPDVITFQCQYINQKTNKRLHLFFGMDYRNKDMKDVIYRMPYHICPVKREIANLVHFSNNNVGEDSGYALQLFNRCLLKTEVNISKIMYFYKHDPVISTTYISSEQKKENPNKVDVIIVSDARTKELDQMTQRAVFSLHGETKTIVMEKHPEIVYGWSETYRQKGKFNYNRFLNEGAEKGKAPVIVFSNNDVIFPTDFIHSVSKLIQGYDVLDFRNQSGFIHPSLVSGHCFAMTREAWKKIGGLETTDNFLCSDNVVSEQIKKYGLKELKTEITVMHIGEQSHILLNGSLKVLKESKKKKEGVGVNELIRVTSNTPQSSGKTQR